MAKHNNPTISEDTRRIFNLKTGDMLGSDVGNMIVPVIPITRVSNICRGLTLQTASAQFYTTPTDKDFYLTACSLSVSKDITATSLFTSIRVTINGSSVDLLNISSNTLQIQNSSISLSFPVPIKIDKGTIVFLNFNTNVANIYAAGSIIGYTVETVN